MRIACLFTVLFLLSCNQQGKGTQANLSTNKSVSSTQIQNELASINSEINLNTHSINLDELEQLKADGLIDDGEFQELKILANK